MSSAVVDSSGRTVLLADRFRLERGRVQLSGVQALVRVLVDQRREDASAGRRTAAFVSGYPGSPLSGLDRELSAQRDLLAEFEIVHMPGLNEDLAATAAWGTQLARSFGSRYDGVLTAWYGKNPGLDRSSDALRHANWIGTSRLGGGLIMVGDDPLAKSSTIPNPSEMALADFGMPVFYPSNVQDIVDLGRHAVACSRGSGLYSGLKIVTNVADATQTVLVGNSSPIAVPVPDLPWGLGAPPPHQPTAGFPRISLESERTFLEVRLEVARRYAAANDVNRCEGARDGWLGIVTAGKPYLDVLQTFADLGISDPAEVGVRILKLGVIWPLDRDELKRFAEGLQEIVVVEEKRSFVEEQLRSALYGIAHPPTIVGKEDEFGARLLPATGELDTSTLAPVLLQRLAGRVDITRFQPAADRIARLAARSVVPLVIRTPFFCSGCPHNGSTDVPEPDTIVGAGTGCHAMVVFDDTGTKGRVETMTQMGGEGSHWIGVAPFTSKHTHFVQNMGDGTYYHSGQLSIRFAVAAGLNATFKIFVNDAVAMTGGQAVPGAMDVPALTKALALEGVTRTIVTTENLGRYRNARLADNADVRDRARTLEAQRELAREAGVTVLIHDQQCAAEKRRLRKRGRAPLATQRVVINERVCEGCGDCGRKSDCASVRPVETEFGRKTQIHQPSCNQDYSCVDGDCPSFVTIEARPKRRTISWPPTSPLDPAPSSRPIRIRMAGIGGTGVVTVSQILGMAALLDGAQSHGLDQTGLAQKGGVVVSDMYISNDVRPVPARAEIGGVDVYLAFDLVAATQIRNLSGGDPLRTRAVVSTTHVPTGSMTVKPDLTFPSNEALIGQISRFTAGQPAAALDAGAMAETLFGDDLPANLITLGAAFQAGLLPLSARAIENAIRLNGTAVEQSLAAFAWGRASVFAPAVVEHVLAPNVEPARPPWVKSLLDQAGASGELRRLLEIRVADLDDYQNRRYALDYLGYILDVLRDAGPQIAGVVARELHRLLTYKDEYEVARLHLLEHERAKIRAQFEDGARVYWHLHPPVLRALGLNRKLRLGPWFTPVFRVLRMGRRLRGTPFDAFGLARVRRVERALPTEYRSVVERALALRTSTNHELVLELLGTPELIRGYENIKLENVARFQRRSRELLDELAQPKPRLAGADTGGDPTEPGPVLTTFGAD